MSKYLGFKPAEESKYYFISYNSESAGRIRPYVTALHDAGMPLWYDYGIPYGDKWEPIISKKIRNCEAMILFFTNEIFEKDDSYVQKEFNLASNYFNKEIYVVMLDSIDPQKVPDKYSFWSVDLSNRQNIHFQNFPQKDTFILEILKAVGEMEYFQKYKTVSKKKTNTPNTKKESNRIKESGKTSTPTQKSKTPSESTSLLNDAKASFNKKDYEKAISLFKKAADNGSSFAMAKLGQCYHNGLGVVQNYAEAKEWYQKGATSGDPSAMANLGLFFEKGYGGNIDNAKAEYWYRKGAENGNAFAMTNLGIWYEKGKGGAKNYREAVKWLSQGADKGNVVAMSHLANCYKNGYGVPINFSEAERLRQKANTGRNKKGKK